MWFYGGSVQNETGDSFLKIQSTINMPGLTDIIMLDSSSPIGESSFADIHEWLYQIFNSGKPINIQALSTEMSSIENDNGNAKIKNLLGLPIIRKEEMLGIIGIANKPDNYTTEDVLFLEPFQLTIANMIDAYRKFENLKDIEKKYLEAEAKSQAILDAAPVGIITINDKGKIETFNPAASNIFGFKTEEVKRKHVNILMPQNNKNEKNKNVGSYLVENLKEIIGQRGHTIARRKDGTLFPIRLGINEVRLSDSILYTGIIQDITELQEAENALLEYSGNLERKTEELSIANAELIRAARTKDEFLANMSHELRTPLNAILGLSEVLLEQDWGPLNEKQSKYTSTIMESGQHLLSLINDILDLSKIEAGKSEMIMSDVNIEQVCQSSITLVKQVAYKKNITLDFEFNEKLITIKADNRRLKQILVNLLSNAIKFTPEGQKIGIKVDSNPLKEAIDFTVWDTGIGINPEDFPKIFHPFVQADGGLSRTFEGTGLGLALVYRLTDEHGGSVSVSSEKGKGSQFTVSLPCWSMISANLEESNIPIIQENRMFKKIKGTKNNKPIVLLAEDNEANIETFTAFLSKRNFRVLVARHGGEALDILREEYPSIILMDIQMPVLDGLKTIKKIRNNTDTSKIPVIALSALAMPHDKDNCMKAGATDYMSKPVRLSDLESKIMQYI